MQLGHKLGVGREPLMTRAGVSEADLNPPDGWVRQHVLERLLLCSLDYWRDPVVTLRVVLAMDPAMMGVVGYLMQCCPTLIDMQQTLTEFNRLVSTLHQLSILHEPGAALWTVEVRSASAALLHPAFAMVSARIGLITSTGRNVPWVRPPTARRPSPT